MIASVLAIGFETDIPKSNDWAVQTATSATDQTKPSERDSYQKDAAPRRNIQTINMQI